MSNAGEPLIEGTDPKVVSIISYLTIVGWIVAMILNRPKSELASFHIRQSLGILLLFTACSIIAVVPFIGWLIWAAGSLLGVLLWVVGMIGAIKEETEPVPILGVYFQDWFKGV
ncbi:MAG: hypothetical protein AAF798_05535 [Bacteroidota bacterium]